MTDTKQKQETFRKSKPEPKSKSKSKPKQKQTTLPQKGGKSTTTRSEQHPSPPTGSRRVSPSSPPPHNIVAVYNHVAPIANERFRSSPETRWDYIRTAIAQEMLRGGIPSVNYREETARRSYALRTARQYMDFLEREPNPRYARISSPGGSPRSRRSSQS